LSFQVSESNKKLEFKPLFQTKLWCPVAVVEGCAVVVEGRVDVVEVAVVDDVGLSS